jgi:hypothetical protein
MFVKVPKVGSLAVFTLVDQVMDPMDTHTTTQPNIEEMKIAKP